MLTKDIQAKRRIKITFGLPFDLRNEFKASCDLEGIDMTSVLIRYMKKYIEEKRDNLANLRSEYKDGHGNVYSSSGGGGGTCVVDYAQPRDGYFTKIVYDEWPIKDEP